MGQKTRQKWHLMTRVRERGHRMKSWPDLVQLCLKIKELEKDPDGGEGRVVSVLRDLLTPEQFSAVNQKVARLSANTLVTPELARNLQNFLCQLYETMRAAKRRQHQKAPRRSQFAIQR